MNTKTRLSLMLLAISAFVIFSASSGGRNSVGTAGCTGCHSGGGGGGGSMLLAPETDCVVAGETISMTLCITDANAVVGGFTINASSGTLIPSGGSRQGANATWLTHSTPLNFSGSNACWTFDYTTPATPASITFDFYGIAANGNGGNGSGDDPYSGASSIEVKAALPISMSAFDLTKVKDNKVAVNWSTASETNNEYFIVERSIDGRNFESLVDIEGQGNSTTRHDYSFVDEKPIHNQTMYYRIQQIDFDGRAAISDVKTIELSMLDIQIEKMYPSPLTLGQPMNFAYNLPFESNIELNVLSSTGQLIEKISLDGQKGLNEHQLNLNNISQRGLYYLVIGNEDMKIEAKPFLVK